MGRPSPASDDAPVAVVADSACDLPDDLAASEGVRVVPLSVAFRARSFLDGRELDAASFWDLVTTSDEVPTTASPSPAAFLEAYAAAADAGASAVVSVHVAGTLSRTVETARAASAESPVRVEVVDSRSVSLGQGLVVLAAARAAGRGAGIAEVVAEATLAVRRMRVAAALDTVEFLRRGGRVGRARAALSGMLRIRPVLSLDDGEPVLVARSRTRAAALDEVVRLTATPAEAAAVFHARADEADEVAATVAERCGVDPLVGLVGAVTGSHLGPRTLGVAVLPRAEQPRP